jgi:hypothetical protein
MLRTTITLLALTALMIGVPVALAQHGHGGHDSHGWHCNHDVHFAHAMHGEHALHGVYSGVHLSSDEDLAELGCSPKMIKTLHALHERFADESAALEAALKEYESKLEKIHGNDQASESALHGAIDDYFTAKSDLMKLRATAAVEARETMGDDLFGKIHDSHR